MHECYKCGAPLWREAILLADLLDEVVNRSDIQTDIDSFTDYLMVGGPPASWQTFDEQERMMLCVTHTAEAILLLFKQKPVLTNII